MKNLLLKFIYNLNYDFFMKDCILLESNPDFCDNSKGVYDELIKRNLNKKYKIIWFVDNQEQFRDINEYNVKFFSRKRNIFCKLRFAFYNLFSRYIIDCNKCIFKRNKNQIRIHLTHGTPLKLAKDYCLHVGDFDYLIQISDYFTNIHEELFNTCSSKLISTGFPRNDFLFKKNDLVIFPEISRKKTVFWFPTYRNHKNNNVSNTYINFPYGVPCINSSEDLLLLNNILKKIDILLIVKLHPAEDSSKMFDFNLTNIKLLKDSYFLEKHSNLYQLLVKSDALITDYSSVYYDYLLTDKPIGLAIPDINDYKQHVDLLFDDYEESVPGFHIYNFENLCSFFKDLSNNVDKTFVKRIEYKKKYHKYFDGNSSARVVELFEKKLKK